MQAVHCRACYANSRINTAPWPTCLVPYLPDRQYTVADGGADGIKSAL